MGKQEAKMVAKKHRERDGGGTDFLRPDALSFVPYRRSREDIVEEAVQGLRCDLNELRKLTLHA